MNAYISSDLNMVRELDPKRHELALLQAQWLEKGGTIAVLAGPSFEPPPKRHEPPPRKKVAQPAQKEPTKQKFVDKLAQRDIEREEQAAIREKIRAERVEQIRKLAETMTYAEAVLRTGIHLRELRRIAQKGGFSFQPSANLRNKGGNIVDEERDEKDAEMIKEMLARGFTRNQAKESIQASHKKFERLLEKFGINYPKSSRGPQPAFFPKPPKK